MNKYTFKINNNTTSTTFPTTNYSKIIDNIISTNIIKANPYLKKDDLIDNLIEDSKKYCSTTITSGHLDTDFIKAANFLANYKKSNTIKLPFICGKIYKLIDGTPIAFYDDEIQIGYDIYKYTDFTDIKFLNAIGNTTKNIIINIFNAGNKNIKINIL